MQYFEHDGIKPFLRQHHYSSLIAIKLGVIVIIIKHLRQICTPIYN